MTSPAMPLLARLLRRLARLRRDEGASVTIESLLVLPLLTWVYMGTLVFFDAFHAQSVKVRAGYTIGDVLSRETGFVTPAYMDSLFALHHVLSDTNRARRLRVSVVEYEADGRKFLVRWSQGRGGAAALTDATLAALGPRLPALADEEVVILVETSVSYVPLLDVGIAPFALTDLVVTRPRFAAQLCWNGRNDGRGTTAC